ncbi:MAG: S8 family peptidase [Crocinitomicaceae bacterium]|nr:S8 family peptidase [Crocinitomicaceae bacterium]MDG1777199.1 S8 family peptidase [Crocinitomicaceae bacterium]
MKLTLLFIVISFLGMSQVQFSANTEADVIDIIKLSKENTSDAEHELLERYPVYKMNGMYYVSVLAKVNGNYNKAVLESQNVLVGSKINTILSVKWPLSQIENILNHNQFSYVKIAGKIKSLLNKVPTATRADSVWMGFDLPQGYTGKDVIIGITDWGFDYSHPMFYDTLLQETRILAAWDQFKNAGPAPTGYSYGTEYDNPADLIAAGTDTINIYSYATHGSHVAGIAGGSGAGTPYRGIGFEANYLFTTFLVDEGAVLDAWQWMNDKAIVEGKRLVINMSWGLYHMDAIDGSSVISQALDAYSAQNVVFVTSGGNNGDSPFHIKKAYTGDLMKTNINFYFNPNLATVWGQSIHMWGDVGNEISSAIQILNMSNQVVAESPWYNTTTTTSYVDSFIVAPTTTDTIWLNLSADELYPTNNRPQMRLRVKSPPSGYKVVLLSTAPTGTVHYWNVTELTSDVGNWGMPFSSLGSGYTSGDTDNGIGTPACTHSAITVAAYSAEYYTMTGFEVGGQLAYFSSVGPLMTDSLKPDIAAPGVSVRSSISSYTDHAYTAVTTVDFNGRTYPFASMSGTSMSSPATAGVITLILQANPYLSAEQVKQILILTARKDDNTGVIPSFGSSSWGWGKVNAYAAVKLALNTVGISELPQEVTWNVYPNPANETLSISGLKNTNVKPMIIDLQGKAISIEFINSSMDITSIEPGVYFLRLIRDGKVEQKKFVKL